MTGQKLLFVVGCPRSGTTWLQLLCAQHPDAATGRETHLFTRYLGKLIGAYRQETRELHNKDGLAAFFDREAFDEELLKPFARTVIGRLAAEHPDAAVLVEKTPSHVLFVDSISVLFDEPRMLHVIRDPRSVVASWKAAGREKWGAWARKPTEEVAQIWLNHVGKRAEARAVLGARYRELFYEDLVADVRPGMTEVFGWLGLSDDPEVGERIQALTIPAMRDAQAGDGVEAIVDMAHRRNFVRSGSTDSWRDELDEDDLRIIGQVCGAMVTELNYPAYQA